MIQSQAAIVPQSAQPLFEIGNLLRAHHALSIFVCRLRDFTLCRELYGQHVTEEIENLLMTALGSCGQNNPAIQSGHALRIGHGEALLLRSMPSLGEEHLMDQAFSLKMALQAALRRHTIPSLGREFEIEVGFSILHESPLMEKERLLHEAIGDARRMAQGNVNLEAIKLSSVFRSILRNDQIRVLFQPIYDFKKGTVLAWEALSRGPRG